MINNNSINNKSGNAIDAKTEWKNIVKLITAEAQNVEKLEAAILNGVQNVCLHDNYRNIYNNMLELFTNYKKIINSIKDTKYNTVLLNSAKNALDKIEKELEKYTAKIVDIENGTIGEYDEIDSTIDSFKGQCKKCKDILNSFIQAKTSKPQVIDKKDAEKQWNDFIKNIKSKDKEIQDLKNGIGRICNDETNAYIKQCSAMKEYLEGYIEIMNDIKATKYNRINSNTLQDFYFKLNTLKFLCSFVFSKSISESVKISPTSLFIE